MITKVVSGGQTGADRAALDVAIRHDFPHGGWCPKGRRAEDGPIAGRYLLIETASVAYPLRTELNVRDSEGTVIFTLGSTFSGGSKKTLSFAKSFGKPYIHLWPGKHEPALLLRVFVRRMRLGSSTSRFAGKQGAWYL